VLVPAADCPYPETEEAVPVETTQPEYVYLSRAVDDVPVHPNANIPTVELPAAAPRQEACDGAVAEEFVSDA